MSAKYCYWSVATGAYAALMEDCVRTARAAGVFKEFHVLTDRPLAGCECYDAMQCDKGDGLFKLHYLKAGMSRLLFDYFVWVDADTVFVRNPVDVLAPLGRSPIHVPLEFNLSALAEDRLWKGRSCLELRALLEQAGLSNQPYLSQSAFWIVRREAIDTVYELALEFFNRTKRDGRALNVDVALGFAMQILCGDPEAHLLTAHPDLWASDDCRQGGCHELGGGLWTWRHPLSDQTILVRPAIVHVPARKPMVTTVGRPDGNGAAKDREPPLNS